jgi:hypothetical protein
MRWVYNVDLHVNGSIGRVGTVHHHTVGGAEERRPPPVQTYLSLVYLKIKSK